MSTAAHSGHTPVIDGSQSGVIGFAPVLRRILVCEAQVPFVRGGAESLVRELVGQLRSHGYETDLVSVPFKWYPPEEILPHAAAWRLLDLSESAGQLVDLV